jgi:multiple sugar transport system substrate-binding protein
VGKSISINVENKGEQVMDKKVRLGLTLFLIVCMFCCVTGFAKSSSKDISANLRILYPGTSEIEKAWAENLKKAVTEKYPKIKIEYIYLSWADLEKKLAVMIAAKDYPDMMDVLDVVNPVAMDALEPLDGYLKGSTIKLSDYSPGYMNYSRYNGKLYSIPWQGITYAHVVNTDLLEAAGYKISDLKSWDAVKAAVKAISKNGKCGYAMANGGTGRFSFRDFMMICLSNDVQPDDVSIASKKKYIEVLSFLNDLAPYMPKSQVTWLYPELFKAWGAGDVGIMHSGSYFTANAVSHSTTIVAKTRAFVFPQGPSATKPQAMVADAGFAIIKGSKQKEAAWKVIEVINSPEMAARIGGAINLPATSKVNMKVLKEVAKATYPQSYQGHLTLLNDFSMIAQKYGVPQPRIIGQPQMEMVIQVAIIKMLDGKLSPESAYDEIRNGILKVKEEVK